MLAVEACSSNCVLKIPSPVFSTTCFVALSPVGVSCLCGSPSGLKYADLNTEFVPGNAAPLIR